MNNQLPPPLTTMNINICYGIFYGSSLNIKNIKRFVHYHKTLDIYPVKAYTHPNLNLSTLEEMKKISSLSLQPWYQKYDITSMKQHRSNHRTAIFECLKESKTENFNWTIIIDPDEFLYFNPNQINSLKYFLLTVDKQTDCIDISRINYEVDVCDKNVSNPDIWDLPFISPVKGFKKSIIRTSRSITTQQGDYMWEHTPHVQGKAMKMKKDIMHFKHYRRFFTYNGLCVVVDSLDRSRISYQEKVDSLDPSKKHKFSDSEYVLKSDKQNVLEWKKWFFRSASQT